MPRPVDTPIGYFAVGIHDLDEHFLLIDNIGLPVGVFYNKK